jgi:ABC-type polysaccharide/polyol phosphate transport system ATPase subunit
MTNVSLSYPVYGVHARSFKSSLLQLASGGRIHQDCSIVYVEAIKKMNLTLQRGDRLGLIGANGAGKTTLLKLLAKIYAPSQGSIEISGREHAVFDTMIGLDPLLTGYENILLRGYLLGLSTREIKRAIPEITEFTELGAFIQMPLKSYSSGMILRLAFGIATNFPSEILLVDEVLGVGDAYFINKAQSRMGKLIDQSEIMILSTHDEELMKKFCTQALVLEAGEIKFQGTVVEALNSYRFNK